MLANQHHALHQAESLADTACHACSLACHKTKQVHLIRAQNDTNGHAGLRQRCRRSCVLAWQQQWKAQLRVRPEAVPRLEAPVVVWLLQLVVWLPVHHHAVMTGDC